MSTSAKPFGLGATIDRGQDEKENVPSGTALAIAVVHYKRHHGHTHAEGA
jgi:hypothetical protein